MSSNEYVHGCDSQICRSYVGVVDPLYFTPTQRFSRVFAEFIDPDVALSNEYCYIFLHASRRGQMLPTDASQSAPHRAEASDILCGFPPCVRVKTVASINEPCLRVFFLNGDVVPLRMKLVMHAEFVDPRDSTVFL